MKSKVLILLTIVMAIGPARLALAHGFNLTANTDGSGNIVSFNAESESAFLDQSNFAAGPANLFLDSFGDTAYSDSNGSYYTTTEGFAAQPGSWPAYTASFSIVSPLIFSDGLDSAGGLTGPALAAPASKGTFIDTFDLYPGNTDPNFPHPGASAGDVYLTGTNAFAPGFGVSLLDPHELEKDIYLASGGTQTYGEFGYAYTVTVSFSGGRTVTTGPLVNAFALADASNGGDFTSASTTQQDRATTALYNAVIGSTSTVWATAASGSWTSGVNWIGGASPAGSSHTAVFDQPTSAMQTIVLTGTQTAGGLYFSNTASASAGYSLVGSSPAALVLASTAAPISITVASGSNSINVPLVLSDDLTVISSSASTLSIGGAIGESGGTSGIVLESDLGSAGTLILSGSNTFTGGITASAGTLELLSAASLQVGSSLVIGTPNGPGAVFKTPKASITSTAAVPEPCTAILLLTGLAVGIILGLLRR